MVRLKVNERFVEFKEPPKLMEVRAKYKPGSDLTILNGFPTQENPVLHDGDNIVFIRKGAMPSREELESLMMARHTPGVHEVVKKARVGVAGLGGLGSVVAVALARLGVGELIIVDYDMVEPSNLNRQQYYIDQIGKPKTEAMEENLRRINPYVKVSSHKTVLTEKNIPEYFCRVSALVEAFDKAEAKAMLLNTMAEHCPDVPVVTASGVAGHGPSNSIKTMPFGRYFIVGDQESEAAAGQGLMAPRVGIAAHHQANCVLRILLGEPGE